MAKRPALIQQNYDMGAGAYVGELERLAEAALGLEHAEFVLRGRVMQARSAGATWEQIGATLGTTRQAAQQRFR